MLESPKRLVPEAKRMVLPPVDPQLGVVFDAAMLLNVKCDEPAPNVPLPIDLNAGEKREERGERREEKGFSGSELAIFTTNSCLLRAVAIYI